MIFLLSQLMTKWAVEWQNGHRLILSIQQSKRFYNHICGIILFTILFIWVCSDISFNMISCILWLHIWRYPPIRFSTQPTQTNIQISKNSWPCWMTARNRRLRIYCLWFVICLICCTSKTIQLCKNANRLLVTLLVFLFSKHFIYNFNHPDSTPFFNSYLCNIWIIT